MGKKSPSAPDPYAVSQAQAGQSAEAARTNATLNRGNTFTPFGSVVNVNRGAEWLAPQREQAIRDNAGDPTFDIAKWEESANRGNPLRDQWESRTTLSPEMQRNFDVSLANQYAGLNRPMQFDDEDARNRATAGIMSRLQPQFERDRAGLESRLLSQGFTPGSEAYARAADELARSQTDARLQADQFGLNESRAAAGFNNAMRGQQVGEFNSIFGLGMPQQNQMAQVGVEAPDLQGAIYQNYNAKSQAVQATNANIYGLLGAAASAGGYAYGKSDRRLKHDVVQIGEHETGLPIYLFRYTATGQQAIGFMADEVAAIRPDAVRIGADGYAEVNYGAF
jgi:hypothetical protein